MQKISHAALVGVFALVAAVFSLLIIVPNHFPYLGVALVWMILASLAFWIKEEKKPIDQTIYLLILLLAFFIATRANPLLTFLNSVAIIYLGSVLALFDLTHASHQLNLTNLLPAPLLLFLRSLTVKDHFRDGWRAILHRFKLEPKQVIEVVLSIGISGALLLVVVPLLASANPLFERLVNDMINLFNLQRLIDWLLSTNVGVWVWRAIFFVIALFFIPRVLTVARNAAEEKPILAIPLPALPLTIPKSVVGLVLAIFFVTQAQLYFSSDATLQALGYSHSQYAREVFAQLTVVAGIVLLLLYNDRSHTKQSRLLTYALLIESAFLALMAFKSVNDYSTAWGFTEKRLWGYTGVVWVLGVLALFTRDYVRRIPFGRFVKQSFLFSIALLIAVNVANFDKLIYQYRKAATSEGIDHNYLVTLAPDSRSYDNEIDAIMSELEDPNLPFTRKAKLNAAAEQQLLKIEQLQNKYENPDWRTFNLSEYMQYREVKNVDVNGYRQRVLNFYLFQIPDDQLMPVFDDHTTN